VGGITEAQTYVVKVYRNASGRSMCRVTEVATGRHWLMPGSDQFLRLLLAGGCSVVDAQPRAGLKNS
jgi:hypothetical protein